MLWFHLYTFVCAKPDRKIDDIFLSKHFQYKAITKSVKLYI